MGRELFPVEPALTALGGRVHPAASAAGVSVSTLYRGLREGGVSVCVADALAVAAGRHPGELWPEQWWRGGPCSS